MITFHLLNTLIYLLPVEILLRIWVSNTNQPALKTSWLRSLSGRLKLHLNSRLTIGEKKSMHPYNPDLRARSEAILHEKQEQQKRLENIYQEPVIGRSPTGRHSGATIALPGLFGIYCRKALTRITKQNII